MPGATYLITKKTNDDFFFLVASPSVNLILLYTLILKALRHGVLIHGFCFMSNHFHLVVTDVRGRLPAFMREFLSETSKALQVVLEESRQIWSGRRYSEVLLLDLDAAERGLVYTFVNPMRAELTEPEDWPGLNSVKWNQGDMLSARRPNAYFSRRYRPDEVSTQLSPLPACFAELDEKQEARANKQSAKRIQALLDSESGALLLKIRMEKKKLAGRTKVLKTSRHHRTSHPVGDTLPRFASKDQDRLKAAIEERRWFGTRHEEAKKRYVGGHSRTVFPPGTYGYCEQLGVRVAEGVAA